MLNKKIFKSNWPFLAGLIIALSLFWIFTGSFNKGSITVVRLKEMNECFKDGQIPCRWVPDLQNLYGYPLFNFHAPLPYYLGQLIFLLTDNFINAVKIMFSVSIMVSIVFIYLIYKKLNKPITGFIVLFFIFSLIYLIYKRDAIGEMWALMFLSTSAYSIFKLKEQINLKRMLLFALSIAFLITSYDLSFKLLVPLIIIDLVIIFIKKSQIKFLWFSLMGLFLGILLSSFYLLPMIVEKNLVHKNYLPIFVKETPPPATNGFEKLIGDTRVLDYKEGSNWLSFNTETNSHTIIRLHEYYFPNWKIFVDGKEILVEYENNSTGLMSLILGKGNHTIHAKLYNTPIRLLSNLLTLLGVGITVILFLISFANVRKWLLYYKKGIS